MTDEVSNAAAGTVEAAAATILGLLPDDEFGDTEPTGESTGDESAEETASGDQPDTIPDTDEEDFDAEAAEALRGDEEPAEEYDESDDEDESDESEDETDDEDIAGDTEPETYTVKVDGQEVEVTRDELLAGYSRTASWTRKSQALAEERKAFQQEAEEVRMERTRYAQGLAELSQRLQVMLPQEPSSDDAKGWIEYKKSMDEIQRVEKARADLHQRMEADFQREQAEVISREAEALQAAIPEWSDEEVANTEKTGLRNYAIGLGFDAAEVDGITDHRVILLLRDAMKYQGLLKEGKDLKGKAKTSPTLKPGKPSGRAKSSSKRKAQRSQRDRLKKSGRVEDAAALIYDMLPDD